jgi:diadenosine tetraphosphate (Ap4A) HIT family hydrolase
LIFLSLREEHAEDFAELEEKVSQAFVSDAQTAARAIRKVTGVPRINYAILGNEEPQVHFHLIPRGHANDPIPTRPPWEHPNNKVELVDSEIQRLIGDIQLVLSQIGAQME